MVRENFWVLLVTMLEEGTGMERCYLALCLMVNPNNFGCCEYSATAKLI